MIGIFDSGVGGLTVVKEVIKEIPDRQIIYFGDTARLPYGTKGADFVKKYSAKITEWLLSKNAKIIVVACNTSSAWASDYLKRKFKDVKIFEMIDPVISKILEETKNNKIGIIGTLGTIKSQAYQKKILKANSKVEIFSQPCPLFVPLVEEGMIEDEFTYEIVKRYLKPLKEKKVDVLVLACTHYPFLKKAIEKEMGVNVKIINPAEIVAKKIKEYLQANPGIDKKTKKKNNYKFYFSSQPYNLEKMNKLSLNKKIDVKVKDPFNE